VKRNTIVEAGETDWSFGQILSVVMIVTSLNEVMHFVLALLRPERKSEREEEYALA